ncbi:MAG: universal stress protein UspA [Sedimenticola sp.]|nr:MAG: universal stress protein UspA [Sedimenticola sp.]
MANYQHILLATDFSDESERVVNKAIELVQQNGARLSLIHIVEYTGTIYTGEIPLPETLDIDQELAAQAEAKLKSMNEEKNLGATSHVEIGIPKKEITRIAEENGVDLIVIGSHGKHGLQLLLGSTANGVLHLAKCDVLAVRVEK